MKVELAREGLHSDLLRRVEEISGQNVLACYQCGRCSAGCPSAGFMDELPNQIMRLVQLGLVREASHSETIWYCVACQTCYARCPKGVDIARAMEALREIALMESGDRLELRHIRADDLAEFPQQAFIAGFRKYST